MKKPLNEVINKLLEETLAIISKCNWESVDPSGCDTHCIKYPCGPCITGLPNVKAVAITTIKEVKELKEGGGCGPS